MFGYTVIVKGTYAKFKNETKASMMKPECLFDGFGTTNAKF